MATLPISPRLTLTVYGDCHETKNLVPQRKHSDTQHDKVKKATRILRDLARDIGLKNPRIRVPSTWVLRSLASSHMCGDIDVDWRESIYMTAAFIVQCARNTATLGHTFVQADKKTALFPNHDGLSVEDVKRFAVNVMGYLDEQRRDSRKPQRVVENMANNPA